LPPADTGVRAGTRILAIYNLDGRLRVQPALLHSLNDVFNTGRFAHHVESAASLLLQVTEWVSITSAQLHFATEQPGARVSRIAATIATTGSSTWSSGPRSSCSSSAPPLCAGLSARRCSHGPNPLPKWRCGAQPHVASSNPWLCPGALTSYTFRANPPELAGERAARCVSRRAGTSGHTSAA
jgi:hypothetical protein